ncbi:Actin-related protein 3, partial [Trichinella pseudospiralis]
LFLQLVSLFVAKNFTKNESFKILAMLLSSAVVIDNGTGYSKIGFAGNTHPNFIIPTVIACRSQSYNIPNTGRMPIDMDFFIGDEALNATNYSIRYPVRHGVVEDWNLMERFLEHSIFKYLRIEPEDHNFLMTESPLNTPENREYLAEVMFESFNVP